MCIELLRLSVLQRSVVVEFAGMVEVRQKDPWICKKPMFLTVGVKCGDD
jgi:hypothetical protein